MEKRNKERQRQLETWKPSRRGADQVAGSANAAGPSLVRELTAGSGGTEAARSDGLKLKSGLISQMEPDPQGFLAS